MKMIEPSSGKIYIDGKDTLELSLEDLRTNITIIPQDPILFSGTIRSNIDPFNVHDDEKVYSALKSFHLYNFVSSLESGILHQLTQGGDNLSVGQRQLLCLARAVLRNNQILVLDEATAALDVKTDDLIQETIKEEFKNNTIISIAHRMDTIMDYDRIMVLDKGTVVELDTIEELFKNEDGIFHSMVQTAYQGRELPDSLLNVQSTKL